MYLKRQSISEYGVDFVQLNEQELDTLYSGSGEAIAVFDSGEDLVDLFYLDKIKLNDDVNEEITKFVDKYMKDDKRFKIFHVLASCTELCDLVEIDQASKEILLADIAYNYEEKMNEMLGY